MIDAGKCACIASEPQVFNFEGDSLVAIEMGNRPVFLARDIGRALGYAEDGKRLIGTMIQNWGGELDEGDDYIKLTGVELVEFKKLLKVVTDTVTTLADLKYASSVMLLTEEGYYGVLQLSDKPKARRMRKWLRSEVLPALRQKGFYGVIPQQQHGLVVPEMSSAALKVLIQQVERAEQAEQSLVESEQKLEQAKPYIAVGEALQASDGEYTLRAVSNMLFVHGRTIGRNTLMELLRQNRFLAQDNMPYHDHVVAGRAVVRWNQKGYRYTAITSRGLIYVANLLDAEIHYDSVSKCLPDNSHHWPSKKMSLLASGLVAGVGNRKVDLC